MSIGKKTAAGFGVVVLSFAAVAWVVYQNTQRLIDDSRWVAHTHLVIETVAEALLSLRIAEASAQRYVLSGHESELTTFRTAQMRLNGALDAFARLTTDNPSQQRRVPGARSQIAAFFSALEPVLREREQRGLEPSLALFLASRDQSHVDEARAVLHEMEATERMLLSQRNQSSDVTGDQSTGVITWGALATILLCVSVGLVITRTITQPVRELVHGAEQIGAGNLVHRLNVRTSDELGRLAEAFNRMTERLRETTVSVDTDKNARARTEMLLQTIAETASNLVSATSEILAGTTQQAAGAQEQAAAVAQTVTTINEVVQTSEQAAQRARAVATIAHDSRDQGNAGKRVIEQSISAMGTVSEQVDSSAESIQALAEQAEAIGEIVATLNDIAEQTNLLALNAAIEAARVGEHGRGFAVVAGEVRTLADQSKRSTAQVRQILSEIQRATSSAVTNTDQCSRTVKTAAGVIGQAGDSIRTLVDMIESAAEDAAQIAASAGQQATGTFQIHEAMKNIDQVVVQNLNSVRQMDKAARDLNILGGRLRERLRVVEGGATDMDAPPRERIGVQETTA